MSFDETNIPSTLNNVTGSSSSSNNNNKGNNNNKQQQSQQQQKTTCSNSSTLLPAPFHARTASSPAQLLDVSSYMSPPSKRTDSLDVDSRYNQQKPFNFERMNSSADTPKRTASDTSDKYSKRSLSNASDKSQRDGRSRTPSERSFILHTPDTPKGVQATPELLAELLKGSSEKLAVERASAAVAASHNQSPPSHDSSLPVQLLNHLVSGLPFFYVVSYYLLITVFLKLLNLLNF